MSGWRRAAAAGLLLLAIYVGLSFLNSPHGFLGTDTGGKVATLDVMTASDRFDPDLGYWAEQWDPRGRLHPLAYTARTASGRWVNVTTLPALWVGWRLYEVGGYRLALLVPMLGSIAAAFAGLALLRRLQVGERWAWAGFWLLGLASPLTIYALDFWEHSLGVALIAWAIVLLFDATGAAAASAAGRSRGAAGGGAAGGGAAGRGRTWSRLAAAGGLFGAAATMRTEALVYLAVAAVAVALSLAAAAPAFRERSRGLRPPNRSQILRMAPAAVSPLVLLAAAAVPLVANEAAERRVVGSTVRASRVAGTAAGIADAPASRLAEAAITLFGLDGSAAGVLLGAVFVGLLVFAAVRRDRTVALVAIGGAAAVLVLRIVGAGLGFVPGLAAAWVLAAAAAAVRTSGRAAIGRSVPSGPGAERLVAGIALGAVPIVLATQFRGGAAPQWAGRYLLTSGFLLAVLGWAALSRRPVRLAGGFAALAVAVTVFGLVWTSVRTHGVARAIGVIERRPEPVIVSDVFHLAREGAVTDARRRWLTMTPTAGPEVVVEVLDGAAIDEFASVHLAGARRPTFDGFRPGPARTVRLFEGVDLEVTSWQRAA